jgi:hypothetical protein
MVPAARLRARSDWAAKPKASEAPCYGMERPVPNTAHGARYVEAIDRRIHGYRGRFLSLLGGFCPGTAGPNLVTAMRMSSESGTMVARSRPTHIIYERFPLRLNK